MDKETVLSFRDLSIGFVSRAGQLLHVLRNIDLQIQRGETVGLVGESGSGKTHLLHAVHQALAGGVQAAIFKLPGSLRAFGNFMYAPSCSDDESEVAEEVIRRGLEAPMKPSPGRRRRVALPILPAPAGAVPFDLSGDRLLELELAAEQEAAS